VRILCPNSGTDKYFDNMPRLNHIFWEGFVEGGEPNPVLGSNGEKSKFEFLRWGFGKGG